jgi:hypothetical protein
MKLTLKEITDQCYVETTRIFRVQWLKDSALDLKEVVDFAKNIAIPKQFKLENWTDCTFVRGADSQDIEVFYITYTFK